MGLNVAFLDGTHNARAYHQHTAAAAGGGISLPGSRHYSEADVSRLLSCCVELTGEVDVLLTCEWPAGVAAALPATSLPPPGINDRVGSGPVAEVAAAARPRYHIAAGPDAHWSRLPYANADLGAGPRPTRFVALAGLASPSKAKALHALGLVPAADMTPEQLAALPEGCTPSPYDAAAAAAAGKRGQRQGDGEQEVVPDGQDWRWQPGGKRPRRDGGQGGEPRPPAQPILSRPGVVSRPELTIMVRNVPFAATEADIVAFFEAAVMAAPQGSVGDGGGSRVANVVRGLNAEGRLNSWMHVQFSDAEAHAAALRLEAPVMMGRPLAIEAARGRPSNTAGAAGSQADAHPAHRLHASLPPPLPPQGQAVEGCWFCLANDAADTSLVASVSEEAYLALDKGAIGPSHCLLVPIEHWRSYVALPPGAAAELDRYSQALASCYAARGLALVGFERHLTLRNKGGNHAHINVMGVPLEAGTRAAQAFTSAASAAGFDMTHLPPCATAEQSRASLRQAVGDGEYFCALLPDGGRLVRPIGRGERWPMNLGRQVLAELAGTPERADWKVCVAAGPEEQAARLAAFQAMFKPYDIMVPGA